MKGLEGIQNIHDDTVIWGEGETLQDAIVNHHRRLCRILERCEERGIALNESDKKFILRTPTLPYMGLVFTADGLKIDQDKVKAITSMPQPGRSTIPWNGKFCFQVCAKYVQAECPSKIAHRTR